MIKRSEDEVKKALEIAYLLLPESSTDFDLTFYATTQGFSLWQQHVDPDYYQRPLEERVRIAFTLVPYNNSAVLRKAIACGPMPDEVVTIENHQGQTLLHAVAWEIGFREKTFVRQPNITSLSRS